MRRYVLARLAQSALVVLLSLTAVFGMVRLGGDPVLLFLPMDIQAKDVEEFRQRLGFNDPLLVQYGRFMGGALRGDFGESLRYRRPALGLVLERLPATLLLAGSAHRADAGGRRCRSACSPRCAATRSSITSGTLATVLGQATPGFWLGLMLIYLFAVQLRWLPTGGTGTLAHLIMPSVVLAAFFSARVARLTRSAMLDVAQRGVHQDRAGQGARRGPRDRQAHAAQLGDPHRDAGRAGGRASSWAAPSSPRRSSRGRGWAASPCRPCSTATSRW